MNHTIPGGFLLAIEGIDGAGKSSQAEAVARVLRDRGLSCVITREPTNGPWGRKLRESATHGRLSPAEELEAFMEDRKEHVNEVIRPALAAGKVVVTDRYYFSTVAYQGARGHDPNMLLKQNEAIAIEPHLLVLIDLDPDMGLARIGRRGDRANQFETVTELARARQIFLSLRKPYLVRIDGQARPIVIRDEILLAFGRAAIERIAAGTASTARERLNACLAVHGAETMRD